MKKDTIQVPQQNKMLSLYYTALGFINKTKNVMPNNILLRVGI